MFSMRLFESLRSNLLRCLLTAAIVASFVFLAAGPVSAQDASEKNEHSEYSDYYTGAFVEYSVRGGASLATDAAYDGWHIDAGVRHSFPMLIGDFRIAYRYDRLSAGPSAGPLEQHGLGGYLAFHPAYLLMLGSDWLSYTLSSIHLELGGGAKFGVLEPADGGDFETGLGPFVSVGGGFDVPLGDPDTGAAPWLNFVYRWHVADFDGEVETFDLDMHVLQVGLGWRINGLLF